MSEQLALDQGGRQRGAVDLDQRSPTAGALAVQGLRYEFLAGSGLTLDEHGAVVSRDQFYHLAEFDHRGRSAENRMSAGAAGVLGDLVGKLFGETGVVSPLDDVGPGPEFPGADQYLRFAPARHHDDRKLGVSLSQVGQNIQPVAAGDRGEPHVQQDHAEPIVVCEQIERLRSRTHKPVGVSRQAVGAPEFGRGGRHGQLVINDQDVLHDSARSTTASVSSSTEPKPNAPNESIKACFRSAEGTDRLYDETACLKARMRILPISTTGL